MIRAVVMAALGGQEQGLASEMMTRQKARTHLENTMSPKPENQVGISVSSRFVGYRRLVKEPSRAEMRDKRTCQTRPVQVALFCSPRYLP